MSRSLAILGIGVLLLVSAVGLGASFGVEATIVPLAIAASLLFGGLFYVYVIARPTSAPPPRSMVPVVVQTHTAREERFDVGLTDIRVWVGLAIGIRVFVGLLLNLTEVSLSLAPDSWAYYYYGLRISQAWADPRIDPNELAAYDPYSFIQQLNAVVATFVGSASIHVVSMINSFVGVWAAWVIGRIAGDLYGPVAQRRAFLLAAFFPSIILWTSINLRDAWSFLAIGGAILSGNRLRHSFSGRELTIFLISMGFLPFLRQYMLILVTAGILLSFAIVRIRNLPSVVVSIALIVGVFYGADKAFDLRIDLSSLQANLDTMQKMKTGLSEESDASYEHDADISTPIGALMYLPKGAAYFLFSPFPWRVKKPRQLFAFVENVAWMVLFVGACQMIWKSARTRLSAIALPVSVAATIAAAYSLVEGNEGTAFRHRAHVLLIMFVFAAAKHAERKRAVRQVFQVTDSKGRALAVPPKEAPVALRTSP